MLRVALAVVAGLDIDGMTRLEMPITVIDLDGGQGVLIRGDDHVTAEEYHDQIIAHLSKPSERLQAYLYTISDFTNVTGFEINLAYIRKVALKSIHVAKINPHVIVAIATNKPVFYSLARMWVGLARMTGWIMQVFRNRDDLDKWMRSKLKEKFDIDDFSLNEN